jgi:FkbM family methyltransferase
MKKEKDYWLGTYEIDLQDMISSKVEEGWIAYDVGANIGYFSLLFARVVGKSGNVFSFEAVPDNITRLQANLRLNEIGTRIKIVPAAVLDKTGKVKFLLGPSGAMGKVDGSAGRENLHQESIEVDGISLDDFVYKDRNPPPDVIKMDIEGGEVLAVKGMQKLLKEHPPLIFLEIHGKVAAQSVWQDLSNTGYKMFKLKPGLPPLRSWKELDWKTYLVAVP